jgi:hypothetical protein
MKLTEMLRKVVLFSLSKYGQIIAPFIHSRENIRKTRNNIKIKRSKPPSQDFAHFEPVELPIDSLIMELPGERYVVRVCLVFVQHQRNMIIVFSQGLPCVVRRSHTKTVELRQWSWQVQAQSSKFMISYAPSESEVHCHSTQEKYSIHPVNDAINVSTRSHLRIASMVSPIPIRLYLTINGFKEVKWDRLKRISF